MHGEKSKGLARGGGLRKGAKPSAKRTAEAAEATAERHRMREMFLEIWKERGPYSQISGKWLGHEPLTVHFDHLLEKADYPLLKFEKENILMVTWEEHQLKTGGHPLPLHKEAIEKARAKFLA